MKYKGIIFLSVLALFCSTAQETKAAPSQKKAQNIYTQKKTENKPKSIWDDETAANPYFKDPKKKKKAPVVKKEKPKKVQEKAYKKPVYTGPNQKEIAQNAIKKAEENFKTFFSFGKYDLKYGQISYNVNGDVLSVSDVTIKSMEKFNAAPYLMKAEQIILRSFNVGEKNGKPMLNDGEMIVRKLELPVWNQKFVKKGKVDIAQLRMKGDIPAYLKAKGEGKLSALEVRDLRSEAIINETVLNNVVRSKILSASSASFYDAEVKKDLLEALKQQTIDGLNFSSAAINGKEISTKDGAASAMTSYSARILNTDLVLGARLEAKKDKPNPSPDLNLLKQNAAENKAAIAATETEVQPK
ncbi:MAG: hypothetical protein J5787_06925 [Alphaproteobacteria bacterium]|nr:hypothetical protein [Alphaproteobacteria bacterium]